MAESQELEQIFSLFNLADKSDQQIQQCDEKLQKFIAQNKDHAEAFYMLGKLNSDLGKKDVAVRHWEKASKMVFFFFLLCILVFFLFLNYITFY